MPSSTFWKDKSNQRDIFTWHNKDSRQKYQTIGSQLPLIAYFANIFTESSSLEHWKEILETCWESLKREIGLKLFQRIALSSPLWSQKLLKVTKRIKNGQRWAGIQRSGHQCLLVCEFTYHSRTHSVFIKTNFSGKSSVKLPILIFSPQKVSKSCMDVYL